MSAKLFGAARWGGVALTLVILAAVGCSSGGASVSGTVTYEGTPVEHGFISFAPMEKGAKGQTTVAPIVSGRYKVDNIAPGTYQVTIGEETKDQQGGTGSYQDMKQHLADQAKAFKGGREAVRKRDTGSIPPGASANLTATIKSGSNTENFALTKPAGKK